MSLRRHKRSGPSSYLTGPLVLCNPNKKQKPLPLVARALVRVSPILCKAHNWWPLTTHQVSAQSIQPLPRYKKRGAHVRTCTCTPTLTSVKREANRSLTANQISAQSVQPFPRYGKGNTSAREHVQMYPTHDLSNMHHGLVSKHTLNLVTVGLSIPEL